MEKETAPPPLAEDTASTTDVDDKENIPPIPSEHKKSVDMATSSAEDPPTIPEKVSDEEKSDDEYPHGLTLFFIMFALCLAVFLVAIGESIPLRERETTQADLNHPDQTIIVRPSCRIIPSFIPKMW